MSNDWTYTTGNLLADELLRRASGRTSLSVIDTFAVIWPYKDGDPEVLAAHASMLADLYATLAEATQNSQLTPEAQPEDPSHEFRRDLRRRYEMLTGVPAKWREPIELHYDWDFHPAPGAHGGLRVNLSIDSKVSFSDAVRAVRACWLLLKPLRKVNPKAVGERTLTLARFVCFESDNMPWADRARAWNAQHPEWAYEDGRQMYKAFIMAERALVGTKGSLSYYYDDEWRSIVDTPADKRTPRQRLRAERRLKEQVDESIFRVLIESDKLNPAPHATHGEDPAIWKLRAAAALCRSVADHFSPDPEEE